MDEADKNAVCRETKVQKVTKGVRLLIRKKKIADKHKNSLEADLALLASERRLGNDLPNGTNALKNLVPSGQVGDSDSEEFSDLDHQRVCMKSGYELKVGMNVAVLVDAGERESIWERWNFAKVGAIEPDRECPGDEVGCIVRIRYHTQHGTGQGGKPKWRLVADGKYASPSVWIEPDAIQMEVEFTKGGLVKASSTKELKHFLDQADENPSASEDDPEEYEESEEDYYC